MKIFRSTGEYVGFISDQNLFSWNGQYLGWVDSNNFVWDKEGSFRGKLSIINEDSTYIIFDRYNIKPVSRSPKPIPPPPPTPAPSPPIAPTQPLPIGTHDAF